MSTEDQKPLTMASRPQKSLEWLDRAWSANWALRLVCVVLFLDMAMMLRTDRGLWQWSPGDMTLLSDVGWMAFVIVIFSLAVAIVIPAVLIVFRQIGAYLVYWLLSLVPVEWSRQPPYQRSLGYVLAHAMRNGEQFLYTRRR